MRKRVHPTRIGPVPPRGIGQKDSEPKMFVDSPDEYPVLSHSERNEVSLKASVMNPMLMVLKHLATAISKRWSSVLGRGFYDEQYCTHRHGTFAHNIARA